ncbi:hypothetical protein [Polaromonas sp.]|uniref:hypothetical protein n=1 Tax=Polaromonas sp. TaxID=1869339 RepID=UPI00352627FB
MGHDPGHGHSHGDSNAPEPTDWKHDGVRVIPGGQLDSNVPSTPGMDRKAAINFAPTPTAACKAPAKRM